MNRPAFVISHVLDLSPCLPRELQHNTKSTTSYYNRRHSSTSSGSKKANKTSTNPDRSCACLLYTLGADDQIYYLIRFLGRLPVIDPSPGRVTFW